MKPIIVLTLFILSIFTPNPLIHAQSKKAQTEKERLDLAYINSDEGFEVSEVPEQWANESAVIICQSTSFAYSRKSSKKIGVQEMSRKRIKLQDKAALEIFSEFYYINVPNTSMGFKIIKPDGQKIAIDPTEAIEVQENVPAMFQAYSYARSYKKLAIPGLEVGDIIDYAYVYEETRRPGPAEAFDPVILTLPNQYPTVKQLVEFSVDKGFYLNFNSYNGAPEMETIALTDEQKEDKKYRNVKKYSFVDDMREKEVDEKWIFSYRSLPTIKFQVYYLESPLSKYQWIFYLGEQGIPKGRVKIGEIQDKADVRVNYTQAVYSQPILKYLKKHHRNETDPAKIVSLAYYYFRHWVTAYEHDISDFEFIRNLSTVLDKKGIDCNAAACVPRTIGKLDEVLFPAELVMFLVVRIGEEYVILNNFDRFTNMGTIPSYMEGSEYVFIHPYHMGLSGLFSDSQAFDFDHAKKTLNIKDDKGQLPISSHEDNFSHAHILIDFNKEMNSLNITRNMATKGYNRRYEWDYLLPPSSYIDEDLAKYPMMNRIALPNAKTETDPKEDIKKREEYMKSIAERDLDSELTSYDKLEIQEMGRYHDKPVLKYKESFTLSDLLQKAGGNYILEIGKFIDGQVEITEDMLERHYDIYMPYARSFLNEIELTIPEGYTVGGLESLNQNVENETGAFISTAKIEGNKLLIKAHKTYKNNYEPKENWSKMIDFLEAAYQFSQQKVVFKMER
ncbi:MAG: DUF3857 domain-containing protein [Chitinophagales bacterium]